MAAESPSKTFAQLAQHLQQGSSNHAFAIQGSRHALVTTGRDLGNDFEVEIPSTEGAAEVAAYRGAQDIHQLADLARDDPDAFNTQLQQMSDFVDQQRAQVGGAWGGNIPGVFDGRAAALLSGADAKRFRSSASTEVAGKKVKGWDENIQTEIVASRITGRAQALDTHEGHERYDDLVQMHRLLAESSSLARTPTAVVAGSYDAFDKAAAAHPSSRDVAVGHAMGRQVGASPNAHRLRTGMMQAFEEQAADAGANVAERQMARVLMARRATTNAFEAPAIPSVTNEVFRGSKRADIMAAGREADKGIYDNLRQAACKIATPTFNDFLQGSTRPSSPRR